MSETIRVSKQVKRELLKIMGELQIERGEKEYYVVYPKRKSKVSLDEVDRIIVVAQNSLAEVEEQSDGHTIKLVFPDNFQAREFREKLANYFPNWTMRKLVKKN